MIKYILSFILLLASPAAFAQEREQWAITGAAKEGNELTFVDVGSAYEVNGYIRAWTASVYQRPQTMGSQAVYADKVLMEYDCRQKRSRSLHIVVYNRAGGVISSWETGNGWGYILPGSVGDGPHLVACGKEEPRKLVAGFDPVVELNKVLEIMKK